MAEPTLLDFLRPAASRLCGGGDARQSRPLRFGCVFCWAIAAARRMRERPASPGAAALGAIADTIGESVEFVGFGLMVCGSVAAAMSATHWATADITLRETREELARRRAPAGVNPLLGAAYAMLAAGLALSALPANRVATVTHLRGALPAELCVELIAAAEAHARGHGGWTCERHRHHPTEDLPFAWLKPGPAHAAARARLDALYAAVARAEKRRFRRVRELDVFVVRYAPGAQPSLEEHADRGHLSFNVLLSAPDDFEGGGTSFRGLELGGVGQGDALVHAARLAHAGEAVTAGTRYILVGFLEIEPAGAAPDDDDDDGDGAAGGRAPRDGLSWRPSPWHAWGGTAWSCRLAEHVAGEPGLDVLPSRWIDATALAAIAALAVPPALAISRRPRGQRRSRLLAGRSKE